MPELKITPERMMVIPSFNFPQCNFFMNCASRKMRINPIFKRYGNDCRSCIKNGRNLKMSGRTVTHIEYFKDFYSPLIDDFDTKMFSHRDMKQEHILP